MLVVDCYSQSYSMLESDGGVQVCYLLAVTSSIAQIPEKLSSNEHVHRSV